MDTGVQAPVAISLRVGHKIAKTLGDSRKVVVHHPQHLVAIG